MAQAFDLPPPPQPNTVGERVRYIRGLRRWSQRRLAEAATAAGVQMSRSTVNLIEHDVQRPDVLQALAMAKALDVSIGHFGLTSTDYPELQLLTDGELQKQLATPSYLSGKRAGRSKRPKGRIRQSAPRQLPLASAVRG